MTITIQDFNAINNNELRTHAFALCQMDIHPKSLITEGFNEKPSLDPETFQMGGSGFELHFKGKHNCLLGPESIAINAVTLMDLSKRMYSMNEDGFETVLTTDEDFNFVLIAIG